MAAATIVHVSAAALSLVLLATAVPVAQGLRAIEALDASRPVTYFIAEGGSGSGYRAGDRELAVWALQAFERATGALRFEPAPEIASMVRVYWVPASAGQYGEMRPLLVDGRRGAAVYIRPDVDALGADIAGAAARDPLLRDAIVYLTCVHELGHAVGLEHTSDYRDVMYFFGFGGDIPGFFGRYRAQLRSRSDIATVAGLSDGDLANLRALYRSSSG